MKLKDKFDSIFTLTEERIEHIKLRHPEMESLIDEIKNVLADPDLIVQNDMDENIRLYHKSYKDMGTYLVVVVNINKSFVITAYQSFGIKRGEIVWKKG
jgi:hypothetical protein